MALAIAPSTVQTRGSEIAKQRQIETEKKVDAAADRIYSGKLLGNISIVLIVLGVVFGSSGGTGGVTALFLTTGIVLLVFDVRNHAAAREIAEEEVKSGFSSGGKAS